MIRSIKILVSIAFLLIPFSLSATESEIKVLVLENAGDAQYYKSEESGRTWLNGKSYEGKIVIVDNNGKKSAVNILPLETYLTGIVPAEMPENWPVEALKAQAVTARTYAYYKIQENKRMKKPFDIRSTTADQVYEGSPHPNKKIDDAVKSTAGEIITYHDKPILARFHSSCGGVTETSYNVWGEWDSTKRVMDRYCKNSPHNNWKIKIFSAELEKILKEKGFDIGKIVSISTEYTNAGNRVASVSIHGKKQTISLTGNDFRKYMGYNRIKSTAFKVYKSGDHFVFEGKGFGHGVGMCQWGAKGMADAKRNYKEIIEHYYPGTEIKKIY